MLGNFVYHNPTSLAFGEDSMSYLSDYLKDKGNTIAFVYGGGSIKRNGIYDQVITVLNQLNKTFVEVCGVMPNPTLAKLNEGVKICRDNKVDYILAVGGGSVVLNQLNKTFVEVCGVMPNPTLAKLNEGVKICRDNKVDYILAVGGGSVIDYAKALGASVYCDEDPWQRYYVENKDCVDKYVPLGCVLTMVGTGSEMNGGAVITNEDTKEKKGHVFESFLYPQFAILNPLFTLTLPHYQMVAGIYDIFSHICEQYFSDEDDNTSDYIAEGLMRSLIHSSRILPHYQMVAGIYDIFSHICEQYFSDEDDNTSDYIAEGLMRSLIHSSRIANKNPNDYQARSNIMWTATWALNTLIQCGKTTDWLVHSLGQAVGGFTDATHGMTLSSITLPYYKLILPFGLAKFKRFAINVWDVDPSDKDDTTIALLGLEQLEDWMNELGLVMTIKELGVNESMIEPMSKHVAHDGGYKELTDQEVINIFKESMNYQKRKD